MTLALTLLPALAALGFGLALAERLRVAAALAIPMAVALLVTALSLAAVLGLLAPARWALLALGLAALGWRALRAPWRAPSPALALWGAAILALAILNHRLRLIFWDEFSHWGTFPHFLAATGGALPRALGEIMFLDYPPGWAIWTFWLMGDSGFREGTLLAAAATLQATLMLPLLAGLRWREAWLWAPVAAALVFLPGAFGIWWFSWSVIGVDILVPLAAAGAFATYLGAGRDARACLLAAPLLALACLLKGSGMPMGGAVALAILLDRLWLMREAGWRERLLGLLRAAWPMAALPLVAVAAWSLHRRSIAVPPIWDTSLPTLRARLADPAFADYAAAILPPYGTALAGGMGFTNLALTLPGWGLALVALMASARLARGPREAAPVALAHLALLLGFAAYAALLGFYFVFAFPTYEAVRLAGMDRYLSSYILLWLLVGFALLLSGARAAVGWRREAGVALVAAWCLALPVAMGTGGVREALWEPRGGEFAKTVSDQRRTVAAAAAQVRAAVPERGSVYILWNGVTGFEYYAAQFELKPRRTSTPRYTAMRGAARMATNELWCHSLGPPRFPGDIWSCDWALEQLAAELAGWDFLLVGNIDRPFAERYQPLFAEPLRAGERFALFRVEGGRLARVSGAGVPPRPLPPPDAPGGGGT